MKQQQLVKEMFKQLNVEHVFNELTTDDVRNVSKSMVFFAWKMSQDLMFKHSSKNMLDMLTGKKPKLKVKK